MKTCRLRDSDLFEERWLSNGGSATLKSYGVDSAATLTREDVAWLRQLPLFIDDGRRFFVHAGVNPDRPLNQQDEFDLLWIRKPFFDIR
jgi:serine/threonine protein phosphatase 1